MALFEKEKPAAALSVINANGEINPAAYANPEDRLAAFHIAFPPDKYTLVLFTQFAMSNLPAGAKLHPQFIECRDEDFWDESDFENREVPLKPGHVMLSAEFVIRIGLAAGIELVKTTEGQIEIEGTPYWRILYSAQIRLPDGTLLIGPESGKAQPIRTSKGTTQAHIIESTDKKARRNAIKELLTIPTQLPKRDAQRVWVVVKTQYEPGSEAEKLIQHRAGNAARLLYDPGVNRVQAYIERFTSAITLDELDRYYQDARDSDLPDIEKRALHTYYVEGKNRLKGAKP